MISSKFSNIRKFGNAGFQFSKIFEKPSSNIEFFNSTVSVICKTIFKRLQSLGKEHRLQNLSSKSSVFLQSVQNTSYRLTRGEQEEIVLIGCRMTMVQTPDGVWRWILEPPMPICQIIKYSGVSNKSTGTFINSRLKFPVVRKLFPPNMTLTPLN